MRLYGDTGNRSSRIREIEQNNKQQQEIDSLQTQVDEISGRLDDLQDVVNSTTVNATSVNSTDMDTTTLSADSASIDTLDNDTINSREISATEINTIDVNTTTVTATDIHGQIKDKQDSIEADVLNADSAAIDNAVIQEATIPNLTTTNLTLEDINADRLDADSIVSTSADLTTATINTATVTNLDSSITNSELLNAGLVNVTTSANIRAEQVQDSTITNATIGKLSNGIKFGTERISLDPSQISTEDDWWHLKIKKNFHNLTIKVDGDVDLQIINCFEKENRVTDGTAFVIAHLRTVKNIKLYSMDKDYYYIDLYTPEKEYLYYSYQADEEIDTPIEVVYNGEETLDWYYTPAATSEIVYLGDSTELYQMTILGKLVSAVSPTIENWEFDDITINKNIFLKDYYNTVSETWVYKKGNVNDYLSNIEDYVDEQGIQHTRIDWRSRINYRNAHDYESIAADYTEDVLDENDQKIGERVIKANDDTLIDLGTLLHYNGKYYERTDPDVPIDFTDPTTYTETNPITKLGTVDEGNWNEAGYVYSSDVVVKNRPNTPGLEIEPNTYIWKLGNARCRFNVWDYTADESPATTVDWVEV